MTASSQKNNFSQQITGDLIGGLLAAIIALPLALAFGVASGLGAIAGLYGAIACGIIAAIFGGTPGMVSGRAEEHKRVNEARGFAGRSLHMGQILIMLNLITPNELKFALETLSSIAEGRITREEGINALREYHNED